MGRYTVCFHGNEDYGEKQKQVFPRLKGKKSDKLRCCLKCLLYWPASHCFFFFYIYFFPLFLKKYTIPLLIKCLRGRQNRTWVVTELNIFRWIDQSDFHSTFSLLQMRGTKMRSWFLISCCLASCSFQKQLIAKKGMGGDALCISVVHLTQTTENYNAKKRSKKRSKVIKVKRANYWASWYKNITT